MSGPFLFMGELLHVIIKCKQTFGSLECITLHDGQLWILLWNETLINRWKT